MAYDPENLGAIIKFKYPNDYKSKILVVKDGTQVDPYIKKWNVQDPYPTQADLDAWDIEWEAAKADNINKEQLRAEAEARLRAPYGSTPSVVQLRAMVDDIVIYLGLT